MPPPDLPPKRDAAALLARTRARWGGRGDLWIFGYASLIWRPEFEAAEEHLARVHGWHRALRMQSHLYRGTSECPGLVFALVAGGSCRGRVYRIPRERAEQELERLWEREMPSCVYDPRWLRCRGAAGEIEALGFTLHRASPSYTGPLSDAQLLAVLRQARGRYGSTLDYLVATARSLHACGIRDREVERMMRLVRHHALA